MKKIKHQPGATFRIFSVWIVALLMVGAVFAAPPFQTVNAATCTTTANGAWSAAIWSCVGGPTSTDDVIIQNEVTLNTSASIASLSITSSGVLQLQDAQTLTLSGNMNVDLGGVFDPTESTVAFSAGDQTITTNNQWIDFYNLTKTTIGTLSVDPSTVSGETGGGLHILETLTIQGVAPSIFVALRSTVPGSRFQIWYEGAAVVDFVDVMDSANIAGIISVTNGINSANNTGWVFGAGDPTTIEISSSANPAVLNQPVTFTATISPFGATGTVSFYEDGGEISGCENVLVVNLTATCTTTFTTLENETITAIFNANAPYGSSVSNSIQMPVVVGALKVFVPFGNR